MRGHIAAAFAACLFVGGCAGVSEVMEWHRDVPAVKFETDAGTGRIETFYVLDRPAESRMLVSDSYGSAIAQGIGKGLTFGIMNTMPPVSRYETVAAAYLASQGRVCTVDRAFVIAQPEFEVRYTCTGAPPPPGAPAEQAT